MTTDDTGLTAISGWTDDEIREDDVRAAGVLYAAAALEELKLIELVEHLNELNQQKLLGIGVGPGQDLLHEFWDKGYKRMPAKRRGAILTQALGAPGADDVEANDEFAELFEALVSAIAEGSADDVGPAAAELHANLAEHTDEATTKAAVELRGTYAELAGVLADVEMRTVYKAADMWELAENAMREHGAGREVPDVKRARTLATSGATILRALPELRDDPASDEVAAAAKQWLPANLPAA